MLKLNSALKWFKYGIRDPLAALQFVILGSNRVNFTILKRLGRSLGASSQQIDELYKEIKDNVEFNRYLSSSLSGLNYLGWIRFPEGIYILTRILKPTYVIETGVGAGVSSAYILMALETNGKGELFSVDLPNYELNYFPQLGLKPVTIIPEGKDVGFAVPTWLKHRWHLKLGNSREILPELLNELKLIDIFLHDSEHTYDHMLFEYNLVWNYLKSNGLLLSDDVFWNNAFEDFARKVKSQQFIIYFAGWGALIKK